MNHMTTGVIESDGEDEELFMRYVLGMSLRFPCVRSYQSFRREACRGAPDLL